MRSEFRDLPVAPTHASGLSLIDAAREAIDRGDQVFQCELELQTTTGKAADFGAGTYSSTAASDVNPSLNAIASQGWRLVSSSVAFVQESTESRDRLVRSGQAAAVSGRLVGVYVFTR
jgi:hypothetical protein